MSETSSQPGSLRTYGPVIVAYLLATALTGAYFWGDSIDYAIEIIAGKPFWEFGHLFWRPLGTLLGLVPVSLVPGAPDRQASIVLLLTCACWLSGLGCVVWLRGLLRWSGLNGWSADLAVL